MGTLQIRRGLAENLPIEAEPGELLFTTDTKKFYVGNGEGNALTEFNNAAQLVNFLSQKQKKNTLTYHLKLRILILQLMIELLHKKGNRMDSQP